MIREIIYAWFLTFFTVCFSCRTDNDCFYHDFPAGNKTTRVYLECCQIYAKPPTCGDFGAILCHVPPHLVPQTSRPTQKPHEDLKATNKVPESKNHATEKLPESNHHSTSHSESDSGSSSKTIIIISLIVVICVFTTILSAKFCHKCKRRQRPAVPMPRELWSIIFTAFLQTQDEIQDEIPGDTPTETEAQNSSYDNCTVVMDTDDDSPPSYEEVISTQPDGCFANDAIETRSCNESPPSYLDVTQANEVERPPRYDDVV